MAEANWMTYLGAVTGVVGALTGIGGFGMGYISYRRSNQNKALDLRLILQKEIVELRTLLQGLPDLLASAKHSRTAVAAAHGLVGSGAVRKWEDGWKRDGQALQTLFDHVPDIGHDFDSMSVKALEAMLVEIHDIKVQATVLRDRYQAELASDDRDRAHIKADQRAMFAGKNGNSA